MKHSKSHGSTLSAHYIIYKIISNLSNLVLLHILIMLVSSIFFAVKTITLQKLLDNIAGTSQSKNFTYVCIWAIVLLIVQLSCELFNGLSVYFQNTIKSKLEEGLFIELHKKVARISPAQFEDPQILDRLSSAKIGIQRASAVYESCVSICSFYIPYFIVMALYLYSFRPLLSISVICLAFPLLIAQHLKKKQQKIFVDSSAPINREMEYYMRELTSGTHSLEMRQQGSFTFFFNKFKSSLQLFCKLRWNSIKKVLCFELGLQTISLIGYIGVFLLLVISVIQGYVSVAAFATIVYAINTMVGFMEDGICGSINNIAESLAYVEAFENCFSLPEKNTTPSVVTLNQAIEIHNVSFTYPNRKTPSVMDISFEITPGETIAIVGENGAGKTTLVRLLIGELIPDIGEICYDDISTSYTNPSCFHQITSCVYQDYCKYKFTLKKNITVSDIGKPLDMPAVEKSLRDSGFSLDTVPVDTILSRDFGGIELSGGQWQRVAIARGIYRNHQLIVLDEPTASIDPIIESEVYSHFATMSKGKTTILVTHRLAAAKIADKILVMAHGKIVECGSHAELMNLNGVYAQLYTEQAKWYA